MIRLLLHYKADPLLPNAAGTQGIQVARMVAAPEILAMLEDAVA